MPDQYTLAAQPRDVATKAKALRRQDIVPGTVYGRDFEAQSVQVARKEMERLLHYAGTSSLITMTVEGWAEPLRTLVRDVQRDPVNQRLTHVDFYRVVAGQRIRSEVPVVAHGEAPVAKEGGIITQIVESVEVECLPEDMPHLLVADISKLVGLHSRITAADLIMPENVMLLSEPDTDIFQVVLPRGLEEEEAAPAEAAEAAEAPAAPTPEEK
jgi:large subunit ribosomal protein L25